MKRIFACFFAIVMFVCMPVSARADAGGYLMEYGSASFTNRRGDSGSDVRKIQQRLYNLGYLSGGVDGVYGAKTQAAVAAFQSKNGIHGSGGYSGTATRFTQALLFGAGAIPAGSSTKRGVKYYGMHSVYGFSTRSKNGKTITMSLQVQNDTFSTIDGIRLLYWFEDYYGNIVTNQGYNCWDSYRYGLNIGYQERASFSIDITPYSSERSRIAYLRCIVAEISYTTGEVYINFDPNAYLPSLSAYQTGWA